MKAWSGKERKQPWTRVLPLPGFAPIEEGRNKEPASPIPCTAHFIQLLLRIQTLLSVCCAGFAGLACQLTI